MSDIITTLHPENDESVNLYPNIKKENIPDKAIDKNKLSDGVLNELNAINEQLAPAIASINQPKYYSVLPTSNVGLVVYSDGYLYSWNGTQYTSTGILYQATQIQDGSVTYDKLSEDVQGKFDDIQDTFENNILHIDGKWVQGGVNNDGTLDNDSWQYPTRIRTKYIKRYGNRPVTLDIASGYSARIMEYKYENDSYVFVRGNAWVTGNPTIDFKTQTTHYIVVGQKGSSQVFGPEEGKNIIIKTLYINEEVNDIDKYMKGIKYDLDINCTANINTYLRYDIKKGSRFFITNTTTSNLVVRFFITTGASNVIAQTVTILGGVSQTITSTVEADTIVFTTLINGVIKFRDCSTNIYSLDNRVDLLVNDGVTPINFEWVNGGINDNGTLNDDTNKIRTNPTLIKTNVVYVNIPSGYKVLLGQYRQIPDTTSFSIISVKTFTTSSFSVNISKETTHIRLCLAHTDDSNLDLIEGSYLDVTRNVILNTKAKSEYERNLFYGSIDLSYYEGLGNDYSLFNGDTTSEQFYQAFNDLVDDFPTYIIKTNLGNGSDGNPIYSYDLKPYTHSTRNNIPKFFIIAGVHGYEKSSCYGLYYFVRDLLYNSTKNQTLDYLRTHCELIIIPLVNRYGFDHNARTNANGVDLARNYDYKFEVMGYETPYYTGPSAFSEPETQYIRNIVEANLDSLMTIDFHTNGGGIVDSYPNINWSTFANFMIQDIYGNKMIDIVCDHIMNITNHFKEEYNFPETVTRCGWYDTQSDTDATNGVSKFNNWCADIGILSLTFEGNNGFPNETLPFSSNEQKGNSELIGNFLRSTIKIISNK